MNKINYLTSGESHGKSLLGIIEGIPANLEINAKDINYQLARRQCGYGRGGRMKIENDNVEILSGLRNGITMGSPIGLKLDNLDWENWKDVMAVEKHRSKSKKITLPRPGHADLAGIQKYGMDDIRNVIDIYPETGDPDTRSEYYMKEVRLPELGGTISNSYYDTPWHYSSPRQINVFHCSW